MIARYSLLGIGTTGRYNGLLGDVVGLKYYIDFYVARGVGRGRQKELNEKALEHCTW